MTLQELSDIVEPLIDAHGQEMLAEAIALACSRKADHIQTNWQDEELSEAWDKDAGYWLGVAWLCKGNGR